MENGFSVKARARFYLQTGFIYLLTVAFMVAALRPAPHSVSADSVLRSKPLIPTAQQPPPVSGKPVRIVIPDSGVDLTVDEGTYDPTTEEWSLSGYHAQFATMSSLANNRSGLTFIYGHNNNYVFGALRHVTPAPGALAQIYTDNGHIFEYAFESATSISPADTGVLDYSGPPIMTIQTCTGSLNEWRTLYKYNFVRVVQ